MAQRLAESFETALKLADGLAVIEFADAPAEPASDKKPEKKTAKIHDKSGPERILFSEKFACPVSGFTIPEVEPRLFSFNNPYGACPKCGGLGIEQHIDAELVIPDKDATLRKGAIAPWAKSSSPYYVQTLQALGKFYKFTLDTKWKDLPKKTQNAILFGSGDDEIKFSYEDGVRSYDTKKPFEGVVTNIERRFRETESEWAREELGKYFSDVPCEACHGYRLKPEALCVKIGGKHIGEISELSVMRAGEWFETVPKTQQAAERNRGADPEGNPRAAVLLARRRPELPHAVAFLRHAVRRRKPAYSPRITDRFWSDRRPLCAGRAVDRPASARQRPAARNPAAATRSRQHRDRRRA
jgi:excinuclease ABC subunit A